MKDALLLIAGILIGFGLWAALPAEPPKVERIHVPYTVERFVPLENECPASPRRAPRACPLHRSLESLAIACAEGRLTHDGRVGILIEPK